MPLFVVRLTRKKKSVTRTTLLAQNELSVIFIYLVIAQDSAVARVYAEPGRPQ